MKTYKYILFIILGFLISGCNDSGKIEKPVTKTEKIEVEKPVTFQYLPQGEYKIELKQKYTISTKTGLPYQNNSNKPLTAESISQWQLINKNNEYFFKLLNISYGYNLITHSFELDTEKDSVDIKSMLQGVEVNLSKQGKAQIENAQKTLKNMQGFSFAIKQNIDDKNEKFTLSSNYDLPLKKLELKDNPYSPHQEMQLQLNKEKIFSMFSKIMSRPNKSMTKKEIYLFDNKTWELSQNLRFLTFKTKENDTSFYVADNFDLNGNFSGAYYRSSKSTSKKIKASGMNLTLTTTYIHEANVKISPVKK